MSKNSSSLQSPEGYIKSGNARKLPIYKCYVTEDYAESGIANVIVSRKHKNGNITAGFYLVDLFCLGVKDSMYFFNLPEDEFTEGMLEKYDSLEEVSYVFAHNLIYGADIYCEEIGLTSHKTFKLTQNILEEDTEDIELMEFEFGRDGKPHLMVNPIENRNKEVKILEKTLGKNGFTVTYANEFNDDDDDGFEENDEFENEDDFVNQLKKEAELEKELNNNDGIYYFELGDMPVIEKLHTLQNLSSTKIQREFDLMFKDSNDIPDSLYHVNMDISYSDDFPHHKTNVQTISFTLPPFENQTEPIYNYLIEDEVIETDFYDKEEEYLNEDADEETAEENAMKYVKQKYAGTENLHAFLIDYYRLMDDEIESRLLESCSNYYQSFPNSLYAKANLLLEMYYFVPLETTHHEVLSKLPFSISSTTNFFEDNFFGKKYHKAEIASFLFLQGFQYASQNRLVELEACLIQLAKLRIKSHLFFSVLRDLLSKLKLELTEGIETEVSE
jgi:hypothetical protein